ncbi:hypothetical protein HDU85_003369 [Gaertneriomyces sp. JEL0708]|nr:hypothetical protein HDU85_003369 [Gaertneriomyces sp. JEL0708]
MQTPRSALPPHLAHYRKHAPSYVSTPGSPALSARSVDSSDAELDYVPFGSEVVLFAEVDDWTYDDFCNALALCEPSIVVRKLHLDADGWSVVCVVAGSEFLEFLRSFVFDYNEYRRNELGLDEAPVRWHGASPPLSVLCKQSNHQAVPTVPLTPQSPLQMVNSANNMAAPNA